MIPSWWKDVDTIIAGLIVVFIVALLLGDAMKRRKLRVHRRECEEMRRHIQRKYDSAA